MSFASVLSSDCLLAPYIFEMSIDIDGLRVGRAACVAGGGEARTQALIDAMRQVISDVALPATLQQANVPEGDLEMLAGDAMLQQRLLVNNPREVAYDDALAIYRAAYWGDA